ncbi:MAG: hypothetical protein KC419_08300, partial [Anaerolineales bacterium]|nr:hypothetical protein [Anaerolineales bacterium]
AFDPPHILTNWAAYAGYDAPRLHEDGTAAWRIYWYTGERTGIDFHMFNHLMAASGERMAQADTAVFAAEQWQPGDMVVNVVRFPWSDAVGTIRSGMYSYPDLTPVLVFDVAGNPAADAVEIPIANDVRP